MEFFDSHAHYNDEKFDEDREQIINDTYNAGITKFVCAGYNIKSSLDSLELSEKYDFIYSICGISPNDIPQTEQELWKSLDEITKLVQNNKSKKLVAIGEIGLDYYWNKDENQKIKFIKQLDLARKYNKPVVIHSRDATAETYEILKEYQDLKKVIHCYSGSLEMAKEFIKINCRLGIGGVLTFKNSKLKDVIKEIDLKYILLETDSPFLTPEPYRGTKNEPYNVIYVAKKIAEIKNISLEEVLDITTRNAKEQFDLE